MNLVAGNSATFSLVIVGVKDGKSAHLELEFPTDILSFEGSEEGTFFKLGGGETTFQSNEGPPGLVVANLGKSGESSAAGSGVLIKYKFKALKPGTARVNISSAQITDSNGNSQTIPGVSSIVTVGGGDGKKDNPQKP
ncbi:MAG: cohesin domain-containing protein [Acidobacteria bacterium]|nr:cohesin domain-containing protein [Acidobacteriota bacterium]